LRPTALVEHHHLLRLVSEGAPWLEHRVLGEVQAGGQTLPLHAVLLGNPDPACPGVGIFGGVHGLERIGTDVVMAFLQATVRRLAWDESLRHLLRGLRLVVMPMVNPGGLLLGTRANPRGVDLMRNAPVQAQRSVLLGVGGQRWSPRLPWYRGVAGAPMEAESAALCQLVQDELLHRPFALTVDCHSGFGLHDRLWFPFAHTTLPFEQLPELHALYEVFDASLPQHPYVVEPQSRHYLAHGDLWDHLAAHTQTGKVFLPLTLEMGSWLWIKKNPRQAFSRLGIFNPQIAHRQQRVLRRHLVWLDFVLRASLGYQHWLPHSASERARHQELALVRWYRRPERHRP
jgi:hypothetical protein